MLSNTFNSGTRSLINRAMDITWRAQEVIADNIANVDTPGFKRSEVLFRKNLQQVLEAKRATPMSTTHQRHIDLRQPKSSGGDVIVDQIKKTSYRNDGNNVDIDVEMAGLVKNSLFYDTLSQSMGNEIRLLRMAITGRG